MMLARVIGRVVATAKHPGLEGRKLLLLQPITREGSARGRPLVAVDAVGAGFEETVYWCRGREASLAFGVPVPADAAVVGIVDQITSHASRAGDSAGTRPGTAAPHETAAPRGQAAPQMRAGSPASTRRRKP
ncbi:MAG: EutN/CcmL family microcompartment protein [Acidobacteria bacterium]|nr:EutN/CcmL family microcompartment protein [Acidobacteriota bacterium]